MPRIYRPRAARCSHCGDVVLVAEQSAGSLFGKRIGKSPKVWLEHADPGPDGEVFDAVDDGCTRQRVVTQSRRQTPGLQIDTRDSRDRKP